MLITQHLKDFVLSQDVMFFTNFILLIFINNFIHYIL